MKKDIHFSRINDMHGRRTVLKCLAFLTLTAGTLPVMPFTARAAMNKPEILIAYFSHTGNTRTVAGMLHAAVGGDMLEIKAAEPYPAEHAATERRARKEWEDNARPALSMEFPADMHGYDIIFIGYPNWFRTAPTVVRTFLEQFGFAGKTLAPFCTHGGNGLADSLRDIAQSCPQATVLDGLAVRGSRAAHAQSAVNDWLQGHEMLAQLLNK